MMGRATALGRYLRARRELVRPEDVGLTSSGRRRVPGLRREELATLAGISSDYYLRLEQGHDHHPSAQVIDAIARALRLDADATAHLHALARPTPPRPPPQTPERPPASIVQLLAAWHNTPAFVQGRYMDILAVNPLASALWPVFTPGVNIVRAVFLDPGLRTFVGNWDDMARATVGRLRALLGPDVNDPRVIELVNEVSAQSDDFRRMWARHDVDLQTPHLYHFNHPVVGPLELLPDRLAIFGADGQVLVVLHAAPGSTSERALAQLSAAVVG